MELKQEFLITPMRVLLGYTLLPIISPKADQSQLDGSRGLKRGVHVQGNRVSYGNFAVDKFHRLQVSVGSSTLVSNYSECALSCVNTSSCSSFNVASSPRSVGKYRCELLNEDKYSANQGQLVSSQEYHHYSIKTPCSSFPCQNGAKCVPNYGENEYHCDCVPGYTGRLCEADIDECSSNPCLNGATCVDQVNGYVCNCQPVYAGVYCQTLKQWHEYTPEWCGSIDNRREIQSGGITEEECKQRCSNCAAIEYWSGGSGYCFECLDHAKRKPQISTEVGGYPPHVFVRE